MGPLSVPGKTGREEGLFSPTPALYPQKAEQEVEQWKKEAASDATGREEPPAPKVGSCPQAWSWGTGICSIPFIHLILPLHLQC